MMVMQPTLRLLHIYLYATVDMRSYRGCLQAPVGALAPCLSPSPCALGLCTWWDGYAEC